MALVLRGFGRVCSHFESPFCIVRFRIRFAAQPHVRTFLRQLRFLRLFLPDDLHRGDLLHRKLGAQSGDLRFQHRALAFQFELPALHFLLAQRLHGFLLRLLHQPRRAGQHAARTDVHIPQFHAVIGQQELADLVRVRHAARFQDVHAAIALAADFDVVQQQPGVDQGRNVKLALLERRCRQGSNW